MVLFFSGTGNSKYAAERIARLTGDTATDLSGKIRCKDYSPLTSEKPFVFVCPTYGWRIPRVLRDYIMSTEFSGSGEAYFVMTCGDGIGNAGKYNDDLCRKKGLVYRGTKAVVMPENYIAMFGAPDREKALQIVEKAEPIIDSAARAIACGDCLSQPVNTVGRIESSIVNPLFYAISVKDKSFVSGSACTHCGLCEKLCPLGNITLSDGKPVWNGNCTHCMACICHCPAGAIEYGSKSIGQPRYTCPK